MYKRLFEEKIFETTWNKDYVIEEGFVLSKRDYNQTLMTKINLCSANIFKKTVLNRGFATSILCSWELLDLFLDLDYFIPSLENNKFIYGQEMFYYGILAGRYHLWLTNGFNDKKRFHIIEKKGFYNFNKNEIIVYNSNSKLYTIIKII
jgi:hypothetical protein